MAARLARVNGVDGSQIYAFAEYPVHWGYIQAAPYLWEGHLPIEGQFVEIREIERYRLNDEDSNRRNSAAYVDALRTLLEAQVAKAAAISQPEAVVLLDNMLTLYTLFSGAYPQLLQPYLETLRSMQGSIIGGYVSCPHSHLLYNLLRLVDTDLDQPMMHRIVQDSQVMRYGLGICQRSAIFMHGSRRNLEFAQVGAAIYFFFLKVSETEVARVEVPEWVARSPEPLDRIQASILSDCRVHDYPESLLLAHQRVAIPLKIGWRLNQFATQVYFEHGGHFCISAKARSKGQV